MDTTPMLTKDNFIEFINSALGKDLITYVNAIDRKSVYIGGKDGEQQYSIMVNLDNEFTQDKLYISIEKANDLINMMKATI